MPPEEQTVDTNFTEIANDKAKRERSQWAYFAHELGHYAVMNNGISVTLQSTVEHLVQQLTEVRASEEPQIENLQKTIDRLQRLTFAIKKNSEGLSFLAVVARAKAKGLMARLAKENSFFLLEEFRVGQDDVIIREKNMMLKSGRSSSCAFEMFCDRDLALLAAHCLISIASEKGHCGTNIYYNCYSGYDNIGREGVFLEITYFGSPIDDAQWCSSLSQNIPLEDIPLGVDGFEPFLVQAIMRQHNGFFRYINHGLVSSCSLPCLKEMLRLHESVPTGLTFDYISASKELEEAERNEQYEFIVHQEMRVTNQANRYVSPRILFRSGLMPTEESVLQLFFPKET